MRPCRLSCKCALLLMAMSAVCMGFAGKPRPKHIDREAMFRKCDQGRDGKVTLREFLRLAAGRSPAIRRAVAIQFTKLDRKPKDGSLSEDEFTKRLGTPGQIGGSVLYPTPNDVVDVDQFFDAFEVLVLPAETTTPEREYRYYARTYAEGDTIGDDPLQIPDVTLIDINMGLWLSGYVTETEHKSKFPTGMGGTDTLKKRTLVVWEAYRDFKMDGTPGPWRKNGSGEKGWQKETIDIYPHTSNLYPMP